MSRFRFPIFFFFFLFPFLIPSSFPHSIFLSPNFHLPPLPTPSTYPLLPWRGEYQNFLMIND